MTAEEWEQVASCLPMIRYVAAKWIKPYRMEDAMAEVGIETLMRCTELWDGSVEFSTYAYRALSNEFMRWNLENGQRRVAENSQRALLKPQELLAVEHRDYIQWLTSDLDEYDRMLLVLYYWAGLNVTEIGEKLNVPGRTVGRHLRIVLKRCREKLQ